MVKEILQEYGMENPDECQAEETDETISWSMDSGSAFLWLTVRKTGAGYISIASPLVRLPAGDSSAVLRHCMEQNAVLPVALSRSRKGSIIFTSFVKSDLSDLTRLLS